MLQCRGEEVQNNQEEAEEGQAASSMQASAKESLCCLPLWRISQRVSSECQAGAGGAARGGVRAVTQDRVSPGGVQDQEEEELSVCTDTAIARVRL